jgi:hypothetical protein
MNPAKHAIQTWKNHILAGMVGLPKSFSIANWCRLTPQCNVTFNMLCLCCQNPLLSAHKALEGSFSFDATPMAMSPLGTEVLVHMMCPPLFTAHAHLDTITFAHYKNIPSHAIN